MPTKNPRLNITFEPDTATMLASLAKFEHKSISSLAKELILEALELHEDRYLSNIALKRDIKHEKVKTHEDAWK